MQYVEIDQFRESSQKAPERGCRQPQRMKAADAAACIRRLQYSAHAAAGDSRVPVGLRLRPATWLWLLVALVFTSACHQRRSRFYPLGIYSVSTTNDLRVVSEAGFNLVAGAASKEYLNAARTRGLKVLASPYTSAGPDFNAARAKQAVNAFDRHPGLWAWYVIDEPDLNRVAPDQVREANRFLKNAGAQKPTALVLFQGASSLHYANITDLLMIDRYPIPWLPLANFPQHVRMARLAVGHKKPLIAVIQTHDWRYYPELLPGEKNLRPPTYEEIRCMTYCALVQRATGLFYYCYDDGRWKMSNHPQEWRALTNVVAEVNQRRPLFQAEHVWWPVIHKWDNPEQRFNEALESSIMYALLRVKNGSEFMPPGDYILGVNNTGRTIGCRVLLPRAFTGAVAVLDEDRIAAIARGWLHDEFGPLAVHVYGPLPETMSDGGRSKTRRPNALRQRPRQ